MRYAIATGLYLLAGLPLNAHPHIFVDTGLDMLMDAEGRLIEVRVTWTYDELYSLLITEDRGLDDDLDGELTEAEQEQLVGFDMQWTEGFNGDLVILQGTDMLTLSGPQEATARFEDGRITTTHVRRVLGEQTVGEPLQVKPYDATYYTAYDITLPVRVTGAEGCVIQKEMPDVDARLREMRDLLNTLDTDETPSEAGLPDIGGLLATTVWVSCVSS